MESDDRQRRGLVQSLPFFVLYIKNFARPDGPNSKWSRMMRNLTQILYIAIVSLLLVTGCSKQKSNQVTGNSSKTESETKSAKSANNTKTKVDAKTGNELQPDTGSGVSPVSWHDVQESREEARQKHIADNAVAYAWFADFPFGTTEGIPYLILRSLPLIAPEEWGSEKNFLDVAGLFMDERNASYPLPRGIGWSGLGRDADDLKPDFASFACGACHVGRVRKDDGSIMYLDGGINTEFNLVAYRARVVNTIQTMVGVETDPAKKVTLAVAAIQKAIDKAHQKDPNFFYGNYALGSHKFDADYESKQIELFKQDAAKLVGGFLVRSGLELSSLVDLVNKNYKGFEGPMLHGFGGMADATGVSMSISFAAAKAKDPNADPETGLPPSPGLTDFMAVWEQSKRLVRWNEDKTDLVDGGGQWNGNIPMPIYRNMAAELTMGYGAATDVRIAAFAEQLLNDLPSPAYPFDVNMTLARKGQTLFEANCADCHRPHNGRIYKNLGTDMSRVFVVSELTAKNARIGFTTIGPPGRVLVLPPDGQNVAPFKEFEGVSLVGKAELSMRDPKDCAGYNALPLGGIWAQAPYLHTGSVPTLFHLLVPDERPDTFIKSRLDYDTINVGFEWRTEPKAPTGEGYEFDTTAFPAITKKGHDQDVKEDGKVYKLNWSDDRDGALAIIEYMKTL